jgi:hypothetical protein
VNAASWRRLTLHQLLTIVVFLAIFAMAARFPLDSDSWWHLQSGRWIVENSAVPRFDPFSHTRAGAPWIDHGWLPQAVFYLAFRAAGYGGLVVLLAALVTASFYLMWRQCPGGERWLRALVFIVAAVASGIIWAIRPQMVSFLLAAALSYLLYRFKNGATRALWLVPLVMLLWANTHGGFAIGFLLLAAYLFGEVGNQILRREGADPGVGWPGVGQLFLVTVVCILILPLNPNTFAMWSYPFRTVGIGVLQEYIQEWQAPDFHQFFLHPFIWLLLAALTAFGLAKRRADFTDLTVVALFSYLSLLAVRNIPLFALLTAPIIVRYGTDAMTAWRGGGWLIRQRGNAGIPALNLVLLALLLTASLARVALVVVEAGQEASEPEGLPSGAVAYLQAEAPRGRLFNDYNWGGYIIWKLPQYPVFVDGRTDLYDDALLRDYLAIYQTAPGWEAMLDAYGVGIALIDRAAPLAAALAADSAWELSYRDDIAAVFVRQ